MSFIAADFPAPILPATEVEDSAHIPTAVRSMKALAVDAGWDARVTVAKGFTPDKDGNPVRERIRVALAQDDENPNGKQYEFRETGELKLIESYALRASKDAEGLVVVWHFERDKPKKRTSDSKKGLWKKGDEYLADECKMDMALLKSGKTILRNVTDVKNFLAGSEVASTGVDET